jgi:hypothetical protein
MSRLRAYNKMGNGRVARGLAMLQGARRENILYGSSTDERSSSGKDRQPGGLFSVGRLAALLLSHRALWLCSFVAPCQPPARKQRAHSPFCYRLLVTRLIVVAVEGILPGDGFSVTIGKRGVSEFSTVPQCHRITA